MAPTGPGPSSGVCAGCWHATNMTRKGPPLPSWVQNWPSPAVPSRSTVDPVQGTAQPTCAREKPPEAPARPTIFRNSLHTLQTTTLFTHQLVQKPRQDGERAKLQHSDKHATPQRLARESWQAWLAHVSATELRLPSTCPATQQCTTCAEGRLSAHLLAALLCCRPPPSAS